jgi:glutamyl-tRNA synthetase
LIERFAQSAVFDHATLNGIVKEYAKETGTKMGVFANVLRLMTTGKQVGAGVFETLEVLGQQEVVARCHAFLERWA